MTEIADTILYGGDIITMEDDSGNRKMEAVVIKNGKIVDVGSLKQALNHAGSKTQIIYLNGLTLMPGLIECHQHACLSALNSLYPYIGATRCRSYGDVATVMRTKLNELKSDEWGIFFGWDPELVSNLPFLSASFLDSNFSSTVPVVVIGQSIHVLWANSQVLKIAGIDERTKSPSGGRIVFDSDGYPTGQFLEEPAMRMVIRNVPACDRDLILKAFQTQLRFYASVGFTTVTELCYLPNENTDAILQYLAGQDNCPVRIALYKLVHAVKDENKGTKTCSKEKQGEETPTDHEAPSNTKETSDTPKSIKHFNDRLWEAGVKLIADGSPHCGTAAVNEPYLDTPLTKRLGFPEAPGYGKLNIETDALLNTVKWFHIEGKQVAVHCHGERACEQVLGVFEKVISDCGEKDNRHRMEHLGLMTVEQIARAGKLNLALSFFVDHLRFYGLIYKTEIFGDRVNRWTPLSEATKNNVKWSIHQDHPAFPGKPSPFANMKSAVTRCTWNDSNTPYGPEYRVSVHEALKAYTTNAAWQVHREKELGSITVGKKADLVVLSKNPYEVDPFDMETIEVVETFIGGYRNNFAELVTFPGTGITILEPRKSQ